MIIYSATNLINDKVYIGQTSRELTIRINEHHCFAFKKQSTDPFHRALRRHGKENFQWKILYIADNQEELNKAEVSCIQKHNSYAFKRTGYNVRGGGSNGKLSKETRLKISKSHTGKSVSRETKDKISLKTKGSNNPRYIHMTKERMGELYNDFISCKLTNKQLEEKYKMSRPTIYRKVRSINSSALKELKDKRYRSFTPQRRVLS